jgi:CDP-diacylglycerol--serine O-phosphatidyltransferase
LVAGWVWLIESHRLDVGTAGHFVGAVLLVLAGVLMVSNVRYFSGKELNLKEKVPFVVLLIVVLVLVVITIEPALVLWGFFAIYAISGPVMTLRQLQIRRRLRAQARERIRTRRSERAAAAQPEDQPSQNETNS